MRRCEREDSGNLMQNWDEISTRLLEEGRFGEAYNTDMKELYFGSLG
jgi:hypothetical protein